MNFKQLREDLEPHLADIGTEAASDAIHDNDKTHTAMLWDDGEITYTKNGDLWGARSLHQSNRPWAPANEYLVEVPDEPKNMWTDDHECRIITDREAVNEILEAFVEEHGFNVRL